MKLTIMFLMTSMLFFGCKNAVETAYSVDTNAESAQQVGDAMAGVDESGGATNGGIAQFDSSGYQKAFARLADEKPIYQSSLLKLAISNAEAASCGTIAFGSCSAGQKVRDLTGCSIGLAGTMSGNVTLTFTGTGVGSCTLPAATDSVSRVPNFSISGLRGATFAVSATSTGQTITRQGANTLTFSNAGIRRTFVTPKGSTILDVTSSTSSAITVVGDARASRTMTGGVLKILNNLTGVSCDLVPTSVAWVAGCNCPTSGSWSGTCSDTKNFSVAFTSTCGEVTVTKGTDPSTTVSMDRCSQ